MPLVSAGERRDGAAVPAPGWRDATLLNGGNVTAGRRPLRVSGAHGGKLGCTTSPAVTEKGSVFNAAAVWPLTTPEQAAAATATLAADPMFTSADHRITAYRVEYSRAGKKVVGKAFDDDGNSTAASVDKREGQQRR